jgi:hypothetical protein
VPRIYTVSFEGVAVSAAEDLIQITGAAGKIMFILEVNLQVTDVTLATGQGIETRARFLPATFSVGSGGTTGITPTKYDPGDAACSSSTCATNNTSKATTSGTALTNHESGGHLYNGEFKQWATMQNVAAGIPVGPSEGWVYELLSVTSGTVHLSGYCRIAEVGG